MVGRAGIVGVAGIVVGVVVHAVINKLRARTTKELAGRLMERSIQRSGHFW
jgi:hypothetical protein